MMKVHFGNMASGYTSTIETQNRSEYKQLRENANWPECVETTLGCKYKQFVTNWRSAKICTGQKYEYNGLTYVNTGNPPFIYDEGSTCNTVE